MTFSDSKSTIFLYSCSGICTDARNNVTNNETTENRSRYGTLWKRTRTKICRLKGLPYLSSTAIIHKVVKGRALKPGCKCNKNCHEKLTEEDRLMLFDDFWKNHNSWNEKRQYVANGVIKVKKLRNRSKAANGTERRKFTFKYTLRFNDESINVCKTMFLNML